VSELVSRFFSSELLCAPTFDESTLFTEPHTLDLKVEFREKFRNISRLMDCVACETCKIHAKLQVLGIGTALRILLSREPDERVLAASLQRNEVIALINTVQKFSDTVRIVGAMREREQALLLRRQACFGLALTLALCLAAALLSVLRARGWCWCCRRARLAGANTSTRRVSRPRQEKRKHAQ
jgi:Endoplasmic Reticulum Oxidoreductin 1 (ERO1)